MPNFEIVVISLRTSEDRRKSVSHMLRDCQWRWRFFDACTAEDNTLPYDSERALIRRGYRLKPAEIGCFASHYSCLKEFASSAGSPDYMLVLEDDVLIDKNFNFAALPDIMSKIDIHYLKLHIRFINRMRFLGPLGQRSLLRFTIPTYGGQAYMVSKHAAKRFMETIVRIDMPVDDEMERYWIHGLPTYALYPYPVLELNVPSTIPKGFQEATILSFKQKIQLFVFKWREKALRESMNFRLCKKDRIISQKLQSKDFIAGI